MAKNTFASWFWRAKHFASGMFVGVGTATDPDPARTMLIAKESRTHRVGAEGRTMTLARETREIRA